MKKTNLISIVILCMLFTFFAVASGESESVVEANNVAMLEKIETTEEQVDLNLFVGEWISRNYTFENEGETLTCDIALTIKQDGSFVLTGTNCTMTKEAFANIMFKDALRNNTEDELLEIANDYGYETYKDYALSQYDTMAPEKCKSFEGDFDGGDNFLDLYNDGLCELNGNTLILKFSNGEEYLFHKK